MDQERARNREDRETGLERQAGERSAMERSESDAGNDGARGGGGWQGYVVPYRYYGRGHAGMGYYAVYFQGNGADGSSEAGAASGGADQRSSRGHAGRGPKGYRRSDDRIQEEINDLLTEHDELDASDIEVKVRNGEATLTGTVGSRQAKRLAEDLAEGCRGVRDVMNQIRIADRDQRESWSGSDSGSSSGTRQGRPSGSGRLSSRDQSSGSGAGDSERSAVGAGSGSKRSSDSADASDNGSRRRSSEDSRTGI